MQDQKKSSPHYADGKICYLEMPTTDLEQSVRFYEQVFNWHTRRRGDGSLAFDDSTGQVSGSWVPGRPAHQAPGLLLYIMADDIEETIKKIVSHGGVIVQPVGMDAPEITARFTDPSGNLFGLYQLPEGHR